MDVASRLIFLRKQKNYTTNKLANLSGVSQSYLRDVELSKKNPTVETLRVLCEALGISLYDFFNEELESSILNDPVVHAIYRLSPEQRQKLVSFLDLL